MEKLQPLAETPSDDQLVYLLDYATALQIAGKLSQSNQVFIKADKMTDINDYHSVSNITASALTSEEMIQYKGESFEKFLINTMLAINFAVLGQKDEALVECRRINEKLSKMKFDGRKSYELSPFAHYLSALLWESGDRLDDAYIAFEKAYKLDPSNPFIAADLIRSSKRARRDDTHKKWKSYFSSVQEDPRWYDNSSGELVVIFQQGWGPVKQPRPENRRFPMLVPNSSETQQARVTIEGAGSFESQLVYDISRVAIKTLNDDYGALAARRLGGMIAKDIAADQIRQKNELLGAVAWVAMHVSDRADLRQWSTLPAGIQLIRVPLRAGNYKIQVEGIGFSGSLTGEGTGPQQVSIRPNRKTFINFRSLK